MKNNYKRIVFLIVSLLAVYALVAWYFVYDDYALSLDKTIKTSDSYTKAKATQMSSFIDSKVATANNISDMLSAAKDRYGYSMMPFVEQSLRNICVNNPDLTSITVTWELSAIMPNYNSAKGRLIMKTYMLDGTPRIVQDTINRDGEYVDEDYYQMKSGAIHTLFTCPESVNIDYLNAESIDCFTIATRIMHEGDFIGLISIKVPLKHLNKMLEDMPNSYSGHSFIIASDAKIYCHNNPAFNKKIFTDAYSDIDKNYDVARIVSEAVIGSIDYVQKETGENNHLTFIPITVKDSGRPWMLVSEVQNVRIIKQSIRRVSPFVFLSFLGIVMMVFVTMLFQRKTNNPMQRAITVLQQIDSGDYEKIEYLESSDDEINIFYKSVNTLAQHTQQTTEFARSMGTGNLSQTYDIETPNALDLALLDMQKNLQRAHDEEENRKIENEKQSWQQNGLAQLGEYLRLNNADIAEFAFNIVSFLVKYVNALQGGLFVSEEQDGHKYLSLKAAYAFDRKKQLEGRVEFGESLVGRCAIEGKYIFLTDVPDGYLYITSGLGENKPESILLVPLKFEDEVHGVIEIASLHTIEEYQITFFNNVAERIASSISNIKKNINTAQLLEKFRTQSDELAYRENEIANSMKVIEASKTDLEKQQKEYEVIIESLSKSCIITHYDVMGVVLELRDNFLEETGYKRSDIVGHNLKEILALTKNDMDNFDKFWNEILSGKSKTRKFTRGDMLFKETFSLITDATGYPTKVISVAIPR